MAARGASAGGSIIGYNPQQWGTAGPSSGEFLPHAALTATATPSHPEDGIAEPPPPYSPEPSARSTPTPPVPSHSHSPLLPYSHAPSLAQRAAANVALAPSASSSRSNMTTTQSQAMTSFPPPPGQSGPRDRSSSRSARSRFGLSALARGISADRSAGQTPEPSNPQGVAMVATPVSLRSRPAPGRVHSAANRSSVYIQPTQPLMEPPSARRSASAGAGPQQGSHFPPPPPGPPPLAARTASREAGHVNGSVPFGDTLVPILSMPTRRPPRLIPGGSSLGPVPPTPADWNDEDFNASALSTVAPPPPIPAGSIAASLQAVGNSARPNTVPDAHHYGQPSQHLSFGRNEWRDNTVKGLRERRSESRQARDREVLSPDGEDVTPTLESQLAELTLNLQTSNLYRQGAVKKSRSSTSPRDPPSATRMQSSSKRTDHAVTTPLSSTIQPPASVTDHTPRSTHVPPLALPTPPSAEHSQWIPEKQYDGLARQSSAAGKRRAVTPESSNIASTDNFATLSLERHMLFMQQEADAQSDRERLELFAEYIVMESRLRRDRYAAAFSGMASDILELTRDLWRPLNRQNGLPRPSMTLDASQQRASVEQSPAPPAGATHHDVAYSETNSPASSRANWTPRSDSESPTSAPAQRDVRQYQPVLSPIPSMAMSTAPDGESRGRSASRWWESEDGSIGAGRQVERTKRESKYMGLGRVARFNLQYEDEASPSLVHADPASHMSSANQYPPEKVGWHEPVTQESLATPKFYSVPSTPSATAGLDVSRLVTLPPPYPRHYPAVNNAHPDLSDIRAVIRLLNEVGIFKETKDLFEEKLNHQRAISAQEQATRMAQMRHSISEQVRTGQMSFAEAAAAEDEYRKQEIKQAQRNMKWQYEQFKPEVHDPLLKILSERIKRATTSIDDLSAMLNANDTESGPDAPMEEGDERPELLEKLKLLKWLAEAREMLSRETFNLESEKCDRYRDLIIADLKCRGEAESKISEALRFFREDNLDRWARFEKDARDRVGKLVAIVDHYVNRGVQDQLSAFWDIGPGLLEIVKKVSVGASRLLDLRISIPHVELAENPAYIDYPLQYLYGLLCHAEKATYQFIDNQIGLWCLSNEVGVSMMRANISVLRAEQCLAAGCPRDDPDVLAETADLASHEETQLNAKLKERVAEVESQWKEALGSEMSAVLEKVERTLRENGGWDDSLQD